MKKEKYRVRLSRVFQGFRDSLSSLKMGSLRPAKFENQCSIDLEMSNPNCVHCQKVIEHRSRKSQPTIPNKIIESTTRCHIHANFIQNSIICSGLFLFIFL
jgi:hypothetical protein